jgi:hypothetical protein
LAYEVQLFSSISSVKYKTVWNAWAPPKDILCKIEFVPRTSYKKRGLPNCGICPLCKQTVESVCRLFVSCGFTSPPLQYIIDGWNIRYPS